MSRDGFKSVMMDGVGHCLFHRQNDINEDYGALSGNSTVNMK